MPKNSLDGNLLEYPFKCKFTRKKRFSSVHYKSVKYTLNESDFLFAFRLEQEEAELRLREEEANRLATEKLLEAEEERERRRKSEEEEIRTRC